VANAVLLPVAESFKPDPDFLGWKSVKRLAPIVLVVLLLMACPQCFSLDPRSKITQYAHIPWRVGERGLEAPPQSIAQTKDGYIWVGTKRQLYRFDGIRFAPLKQGESRNGPYVQDTRFLFVASDGALYISSRSFGVFRWNDGKVQKIGENRNYPGPFEEDSSGAIWFPPGRFAGDDFSICRITNLQERCLREVEGGPHGPFASLLLDQGGARWLGGESRLVYWAPGRSPQVFRVLDKSRTGSNMIVAIAKGNDGTIWAGIENGEGNKGLVYLRQSALKDYISPGLDGRRLSVHCIFTDTSGSLWIGTTDDGLYRITGSRIDHFSQKDGLTGDTVNQVFEDHEGSIWVVTPQGLDQFYELPVLTYGEHEGLSGGSIHAVAATANDDEVWAGALDGLHILDAKGIRPVRHVTIPAVGSVGDLYRDITGTMWVAGSRRLAFYKNGQFHLVTFKGNPDIGTVVELSEDSSGELWGITLSSEYGSALNHIHNGVIADRYYWAKTPGQDAMSSISWHPREGLWLCTVRGLLYWFHEGEFERLLSEGAGFGLSPDRDGSWAYPANDLLRLQDERARSLELHLGSSTNHVLNMINDGNGSLWLYMSEGLVQVKTSDIQHWWSNEISRVPTRLFDSSDGVISGISTSRPAVSKDGQVWFSNGQNLQRIDPKHIPQNAVVPPVHVESFAANGRSYSLMSGSTVALPPHIRNLEIHYAALSFVKPDRVKCKYRLIGLNRDWMDAGSSRVAMYNNLKPGNYSFQLIAANSDGVWNTTGASLTFSVAPAWFETTLFKLCILVSIIFLLYCLMFLEKRRYMKVVHARYQERLEERTRIARNLHDTLIQTIEGSKLVADHARERPRDMEGMNRALEQLSVWLGRATEEGRLALDSLRSTPPEDVAMALFKAAESCIPKSMQSNIVVKGTSRELEASIQDEAYRISVEAIRNACIHSAGSVLTIKIDYGRDFVITVNDNGRGGDVSLMREGKQGHYGIKGMYERARNIDSTLSIESRPEEGTTIALKVPGRLAYKSADFMRLVRRLTRRQLTSKKKGSESYPESQPD